MALKISVGRRLALLIATQTAIVFGLTWIASCSLREVAAETDRMYRQQLLSIEDIAAMLEAAAELQAMTRVQSDATTTANAAEIAKRLGELNEFQRRYAADWDIARGTSDGAKELREDVLASQRAPLLEQEEKALAALEEALRVLNEHSAATSGQPTDAVWRSVIDVRHTLAALLDVHVALATISHEHVQARDQQKRLLMLIVGIAGTLLTFALGFLVRRAIAPRIQRLVSKVKRFKDFGVNERVVETGSDEITVLANALESGFAAIAERDRERDQFLSIAAHELKTPVTSIQGFATLLRDDDGTPESRHRAVEIINRQAWRLSRLIEGLFLMVRARSGALKFSPRPLDLSALTERAVQELKPLISGSDITIDIEPSCRILGDETLLEHAIFSLITSALTLFNKCATLVVSLKKVDEAATHVRLTLSATGVGLTTAELENLFVPFRAIEFENGHGARSTVGLYLSREIARLHNGRLYAESSSSSASLLTLELPS